MTGQFSFGRAATPSTPSVMPLPKENHTAILLYHQKTPLFAVGFLHCLELQVLPFMVHDSHIRYGYAMKMNWYMPRMIPLELPPSQSWSPFSPSPAFHTFISAGIISGTRAFQAHPELINSHPEPVCPPVLLFYYVFFFVVDHLVLCSSKYLQLINLYENVVLHTHKKAYSVAA